MSKFEFFVCGAFIIIFVFFAASLFQIDSQANTLSPTSQLEITAANISPTVQNTDIKICSGTATAGEYSTCSDISSSIVLTAGGTDVNTIVFIGHDDDGNTDLAATAEAVFYHGTLSSPVGSNCTSSNRYCYTDITCSKGFSVNASSSHYGCNLNLAYYTSRTSNSSIAWGTWVRITDADGLSASTNTTNEEVNTIIAATFSDISFGSKALGYEGGSDDYIEAMLLLILTLKQIPT